MLAGKIEEQLDPFTIPSFVAEWWEVTGGERDGAGIGSGRQRPRRLTLQCSQVDCPPAELISEHASSSGSEKQASLTCSLQPISQCRAPRAMMSGCRADNRTARHIKLDQMVLNVHARSVRSLFHVVAMGRQALQDR